MAPHSKAGIPGNLTYTSSRSFENSNKKKNSSYASDLSSLLISIPNRPVYTFLYS